MAMEEILQNAQVKVKDQPSKKNCALEVRGRPALEHCPRPRTPPRPQTTRALGLTAAIANLLILFAAVSL